MLTRRRSPRALTALLSVVGLAGSSLIALSIAPAAHADAAADIQITEVAYGGLASGAHAYPSDPGDGEYVELTNVGGAAQDLKNWSYGRNKATTAPAAGTVDLSSLGTVQPGESVIITDLTPTDFRNEWGLKSSVKVINDGTTTIDSGPDTVGVFDGNGTLVDSVGYIKGSLSAKGVAAEVQSGQTASTTIASGWTDPATVGDADGAWTSANGAIGSPGTSALGTRTAAQVRETGQSGASTGADIQITELAYGGLSAYSGDTGDGEYVELTNVGYAAQDLTGWHEDVTQGTTDEGLLDLSGLGTVAPGESVIITDLTPADFRTQWGLKSSVPVISDKQGVTTPVTLNSGPDTVTIENSSNATVEQVSYAKGYFSGKGVAAFVNYGQLDSTSTTTGWTTPATVGDAEASWTSANGAVGSPGASTYGTTTPADVANGGVTITGAGNQDAQVGTPFTSTTPSATGGTGTYTWTATGLPDGLSVDSGTGVISGTPTAKGSASVTLTATDSLGNSGQVMFTLTTVSVDANWSDIVINEVTSDNTDNAELTSHLPAALQGLGLSDVVELYNKGTQPVDISGWLETDSHAASTATDFSGRVYDASGTKITAIPAHGYGVFQSGQGLSSGGDSVKVYLPTGTLVDSVTWTAAQAGYDESVDPGNAGPTATTEIYHALARCGDGNGAANDNTAWFSVKVASFGSSNDASCDTSTDPDAAVKNYNEQPPTGLPGTCTPSAPSGSDGITVPDALVWPTTDGVHTVDDQCEFVTDQDPTGNDMSSLVFSADGSVLWGAQNKSHLWKLIKDPSTGIYEPATDNGWGNGKAITFGGTDPNASQPDDEGLTVGGNGDLFATSERDNINSSVSKDEVLEYDPTASGTTLAPVHQWDLTSDFVPSVIAATGDDANLGFEGVTYVPDSFLTAHGFHDQHLNKAYDPADYPGHGSGLFFLGFEKNGHVYAYALNSDGSFQRVAEIDTGIDGTSAIADLQFNADDQGIWTDCDNDCGVVDSLLRINADGDFTRVASYHRPSGLPDDNLEGFAIAPASTATNGKREVVWSDDGIYGEGNAWNADKTANVPSADWGHGLYAGTLPVSAAPSAITGAIRTAGQVGLAFSSPALSTSGAFPDVVTFAVSQGSLPAGLSLDPATGAITGTPTAAGSFAFTLSASNGVGTPATQPETITIAPGTQTLRPEVSIGGSGVFGTTLTAIVGTWDAGSTQHYTWSTGSTTLGTDAPLKITDPSLVNKTVTLTVTSTEPGDDPVTRVASTVIAPVTPVIKVGAVTVTWGRSGKVTVAVTAPAAGDPLPTGTVKILRGSTTIATASYSASTRKWTATIKAGFLKPGSYQLTAVYLGQGPYSGVSSTFTYKVSKATPKSVKAPAVHQRYGHAATVTATVASGLTGASAHVATGTVTLKSGHTVLARGTLHHGEVHLSIKARKLARGRHVLTLSYGGDAYLTSKTGSVAVRVR